MYGEKPKEKKYLLNYDSNNSGGGWWLTDEDWKAMEQAGWKVEWEQFLGSIAQRATIETDNVKETIEEWEFITGQDASAEGCTCCGPPHEFDWTERDGTTHSIERVFSSRLKWDDEEDE